MNILSDNIVCNRPLEYAVVRLHWSNSIAVKILLKIALNQFYLDFRRRLDRLNKQRVHRSEKSTNLVRFIKKQSTKKKSRESGQFGKNRIWISTKREQNLCIKRAQTALEPLHNNKLFPLQKPFEQNFFCSHFICVDRVKAFDLERIVSSNIG